jgi:hypothetical protein
MCFEFVHACESLVADRIINLCGDDNCFLVCIGHLNYFYCNNKDLIRGVKEFLGERGIILHNLSEKEMLSVLDSVPLKEYQVFHGNPVLFETFREKPEAAKF